MTAEPTLPSRQELELMADIGHEILARAESIRDDTAALAAKIAERAITNDNPMIRSAGIRAIRQTIELLDAAESIAFAGHDLERDAEIGLEDLERTAKTPNHPNGKENQ